MDFKSIVMERYATKKFDGKQIHQQKVDELLEIIRFSASSLNIQPWKIKVISDPATKEKLSPASWNQPQITTCSHLLVFCADTDLDSLTRSMENKMLITGVSKENVDSFMKMARGFIATLDDQKKLAWVQRQLYIALGNAINGAKSLGFDSCPMEGFSQEEYSKILGLSRNLVPTVLCPIGYAADVPRKKLRFGKEEVFF